MHTLNRQGRVVELPKTKMVPITMIKGALIGTTWREPGSRVNAPEMQAARLVGGNVARTHISDRDWSPEAWEAYSISRRDWQRSQPPERGPLVRLSHVGPKRPEEPGIGGTIIYDQSIAGTYIMRAGETREVPEADAVEGIVFRGATFALAPGEKLSERGLAYLAECQRLGSNATY